MEDPRLRQYFLQPSTIYQRQYEALRAYFVQGRSLKEIAQEFGYEYGSLRYLVCQFRAQLDGHQTPPFFRNRNAGDRPVKQRRRRNRPNRKSLKPPIASS